MAFQQVSVAGIPPIGNPAARNLVQNLMAGMQAGAMPAHLYQQGQAQNLANQLAQARLSQAPEAMRQMQLANQMRRLQIQQMPEQLRQMQIASAIKQAQLQQMPEQLRQMQIASAIKEAQLQQMPEQLKQTQIANAIKQAQLQQMPEQLKQMQIASAIKEAQLKGMPEQLRQTQIANAIKQEQLQQMPEQLRQMQIASAIKQEQLQQMPEQLRQMQIANAIKEAQLKGMPESMQQQSDINEQKKELIHEQVLKMQRDAQNPFLKTGISGDMGQVLQLEAIKNRYGENSDVYRRALDKYNQQAQSSKILNDYRQSLIAQTPKRFSTNLAKTQQEIEEVKDGFVPGTGRTQRIDPSEKDQYLKQAQLNRQKIISDPQTRQKALYAQNIDKTLKQINVDDLVSYSGIPGQLQKNIEKGFSAIGGTPSQQFINYEKASTAALLLAKQVRQFYGDSITLGIQQKLEELTNPSSWMMNPNIAKQNFNELKKILNLETSTYRSALKEMKEFQDPNNEDSQTVLISRGGRAFRIPRSQIDEALRTPGVQLMREKK